MPRAIPSVLLIALLWPFVMWGTGCALIVGLCFAVAACASATRLQWVFAGQCGIVMLVIAGVGFLVAVPIWATKTWLAASKENKNQSRLPFKLAPVLFVALGVVGLISEFSILFLISEMPRAQLREVWSWVSPIAWVVGVGYLVAFLGFTMRFCLRPPPHILGGHPLDDLLEGYDFGLAEMPGAAQADDHVRSLGPVLLPVLGAWLRESDKTDKKWRLESHARFSRKWPFIRIVVVLPYQRRARALYSCAALGPVAVSLAPDIVGLFDDTRAAQKAVDTLVSWGELAVPALESGLAHSSVKVRTCSAQALWRISRDAEVMIRVIKSALADPEPNVRRACLEAMRWSPILNAELTPLFREAVKDGDLHTRLAAAELLAKLGHQAEAKPVILEALNHPDPFVRSSGVHAASCLPDKKAAATALIACLADSSAHVRMMAAILVGVLGPEALAALPSLRKLLNDPDKFVRQCAAGSIRGIELHRTPPSPPTRPPGIE